MKLALLKAQLAQSLHEENTGHGMDHLERVLDLARSFSKQITVDEEKMTLIALLHDVDDYKLTKPNHANNLPHATRWMQTFGIPSPIQEAVKHDILRLGFNKALEGIRPDSIEGKIVSDADMCDALGAQGLLRVYAFAHSRKQPFFLPNVFPNLSMSAEIYRQQGTTHTINHFFEKLLRLPTMMLTEEGKKEAKLRQEWMIQFLFQFFKEEKVPAWTQYLLTYLDNQKQHSFSKST